MATPSNDRETLLLLSQQVERLIRLVEGNGKEGITGRIERLERNQEMMDRDMRAAIERIEDRISSVNETVLTHLDETRENEEKRNSFWERVGLEILKMFLAIVTALITAKLFGI